MFHVGIVLAVGAGISVQALGGVETLAFAPAQAAVGVLAPGDLLAAGIPRGLRPAWIAGTAAALLRPPNRSPGGREASYSESHPWTIRCGGPEEPLLSSAAPLKILVTQA